MLFSQQYCVKTQHTFVSRLFLQEELNSFAKMPSGPQCTSLPQPPSPALQPFPHHRSLVPCFVSESVQMFPSVLAIQNSYVGNEKKQALVRCLILMKTSKTDTSRIIFPKKETRSTQDRLCFLSNYFLVFNPID